MNGLFGILARTIVLLALSLSSIVKTQAADWTISGTVLGPGGLITDGAVSISGSAITAVGPAASIPAAIKLPGIILPGFIDLHNHLPWNVLPRLLPGRKFANRYEWQETPECDRLLVQPHNATRDTAACESEIYAEIKALAGGATSVVGSLVPDSTHPKIDDCALGLARNLDLKSGPPFTAPDGADPWEKAAGAAQPLLDVVDNEVFPMELTHLRMDFLLCELDTGKLRSLIVHLSEGAANDASAHRQFAMLSRAKLLRAGLAIIHGTALRDQDFLEMANSHVGLIYADPNSPAPTMTLPDVPWYAGITALQAMIIGEAMHPSNFSFRVVYRSIYGAFVDSIDAVIDEDIPDWYWLLAIDGIDSNVGASEGRDQDDGPC